jgi:rhomboid protease GluP
VTEGAAPATPETRPAIASWLASWLTWSLIAVNVVVFVAEVATTRGVSALWSVPPRVAVVFGANYAGATVAEGRVETLVTACFVHFSLLHIGFNMYALRQVMPFLEKFVGAGRAATLYLVSGVVGSMVSALWGWVRVSAVSAGASGAICGLIGAALVVGWRVGGRQSPLVRLMARWLVTVLVIGAIAGFDNAAHAGGAFAGAMVALTWRRGPETPTARWTNLAFFALVVVACAGRVVYENATNPFATMTVNERITAAQDAMHAGDCTRARAAIAAARREAPRAEEVLDDVQIVRAACGAGEEL